MSSIFIRYSFVLFISFVSFGTFATQSTIGTHSLILLGDYAGSQGHVHGTAVIGGDITSANNSLEIGHRLTVEDGAVDAIIVLGDINSGNINLVGPSGNTIVYGGSIGTNTTFDSSDLRRTATTQDIEYASSLFEQVKTDSSFLSSLQSNGTFSDHKLVYSGTEALAVFDIDGALLNNQNDILKLTQGMANTVVINVSGKNVTFKGNATGDSGFTTDTASNIVWNFFEAETVDFINYSPKGSIIAPYANLTGGDFDGSVAAKSYTGNQQFHFYLFEGSGDIQNTTTSTTTDIPAPSSLAFMLIIPAALLLRRRLTARHCA